MNNRLEQFLSAENISQAEFADTIGVARASVSHILAGRNKPSYDFLTGMMQHYPRLNMEWLLAGKGKMYKEPSAYPAPVPDETAPDLFSIPPREEPIPMPPAALDADPAATEMKVSPEITPQKADNQRKITKIIVFFDDNTFQELPEV
ncbi:MAG: helix-turn-helix transcriptional regulator [Bacteroidales bacterium]|nr:helix-turn-helix transcriptional regulator [Bacteroidales bacterium]